MDQLQNLNILHAQILSCTRYIADIKKGYPTYARDLTLKFHIGIKNHTKQKG